MNADELLRRALDCIDWHCPQVTGIREEIRAYLSCIENAENYARSEGPFGYLVFLEPPGIHFRTNKPNSGEFSPCFLHPPRPMKPMTEEEILDLYNRYEEQLSVHSTMFHFHEFARAIERHHGIGGSDD